MKFHYSIHAKEEMKRRKISKAMAEAVLQNPDQKVPEMGDIVCYQSKVPFGKQTYLLRIMVNETKNPATVVTLYRTSKITKYWKTP